MFVDDHLEMLVVVVGEGWCIYVNVCWFLVYVLLGGVVEILIMLVGLFVGFLFLLLVV